MHTNRTIFNFNLIWYLKKKLLSAYTETALNGDFSPKSAIISKNTKTKKFFFLILSNYIIRDDLSQKTISRYCPFNAWKFFFDLFEISGVPVWLNNPWYIWKVGRSWARKYGRSYRLQVAPILSLNSYFVSAEPHHSERCQKTKKKIMLRKGKAFLQGNTWNKEVF